MPLELKDVQQTAEIMGLSWEMEILMLTKRL
jgi:hypothetical protein